VREATSPDNIIFEHRDEAWTKIMPKIVRTFFVIMAMFLVMSWIDLKISAAAAEIEPADNTKCPFLQEAFKEKPNEFRKIAALEWRVHSEDNSPLEMLECFCSNELKRLHWSDPICSEWLSKRVAYRMYAMGASILIVFVNLLLRLASIFFIKGMKLSTYSI